MICRTTSVLAVVVLTSAGVALGQGVEGPPEGTGPEGAAAEAAAGGPSAPVAGEGGGATGAADGKGGGSDTSVGGGDAAAGAGASSEQVASAAGDDDDLDFMEAALEPPPEPPMVMPDYDQPQLQGFGREPHHDHRWMWHNLTAVRLNPLGLTNRFRTGYQLQLSHRPEPIFYESYGSIQLDTEINPAYAVVGPRIEVQPVKLFNFWASYGVVGNFGAFSYTRSFDSAAENYPDSRLDNTRDQDYAAAGHRATVSGMFQVGIAGLAMRSNVKGHYAALDLKDDDTVYWDATLDVLLPNQGWVITNDADLLAITDFDLIIGLRYTFTHALYRKEHLGGAENVNTPTHRVGPALMYTFFDDGPGTTWNKPMLVLLSQWWAGHRYRTSKNPAMPYLVLAFVQQGDFMISDLE